ncbi:MAG: LCP family protein [Chloroflexi bacterium]|nr:LCP family protein [Chloroflexota bacterium]
MRQHRDLGRERPRREIEGRARRNRQKLSPAFLSITTLFVVFIAGGLYFGCVFINSVTTMFAWIPVPRPPVPIGQWDNLPAWKGTERINILLLGLDQRPDERGQPTRSDTIIVLTIDPVAKSAGMLSIPRDLLVSIPGYGEEKINTAHFFGEAERKGSGPLLAKQTVQNFLGVPIHYYARIDFQGFEQLINAVGGVTIDVPRPLKDDEYPTENYGIQRVYVPAGIQHMDGRLALQYARSRHADSDLGRVARQRAVLMAARQQALRLDLLPRLPGMLNTLLQSFQTDLSPSDLLGLARLAKDVDTSSIVSAAFDETMVRDVNRNGMAALTVQREDVAKVVNQVFYGYRVKREEANIEVQNGTDRAGLAASAAALLKDAGYSVPRVGNASSDYKDTMIIDYSGKKATSDAIANLLKVSPKSIRSMSSQDKSDVDILVILGLDAQLRTAN